MQEQVLFEKVNNFRRLAATYEYYNKGMTQTRYFFSDGLDISIEAFSIQGLPLETLKPDLTVSFSAEFAVTVSGDAQLPALSGDDTHFVLHLVLSDNEVYDSGTDAVVPLTQLDMAVKVALQV